MKIFPIPPSEHAGNAQIGTKTCKANIFTSKNLKFAALSTTQFHTANSKTKKHCTALQNKFRTLTIDAVTLLALLKRSNQATNRRTKQPHFTNLSTQNPQSPKNSPPNTQNLSAQKPAPKAANRRWSTPRGVPIYNYLCAKKAIFRNHITLTLWHLANHENYSVDYDNFHICLPWLIFARENTLFQ